MNPLPENDIPPSATPADPNAPTPLPALPPPIPAKASPDIAVLGKVDVLTDAEATELQACEAVIGKGWHMFVEVGLALARIRDGQLYRVKYESFEAYCRAQWEYGRHYVNRLISAAQVFKCLVTTCHQIEPELEAQVRPLIGLSPEQAQLAWECAAQMAGKHTITARMVKIAMKELEFVVPKPETRRQPQVNRVKQRRLISEAFGELLLLLRQKAAHELLTEKVEVLHRHVQLLAGGTSGKE